MNLEELEKLDTESLRKLNSEIIRDTAQVRKQLERQLLASSLASRRAKRLASDTLLGCRLDQRIDQLFTAIREGKPRIPAGEIVQVIDGMIARAISRRIWIGIVTIIAIIPAVTSLVLLGVQNKTMLTKLEAEEMDDVRKDLNELHNLLGANRIRWIGSGSNRRLENLNTHHPRIRASAMTTLVAMEKQRWTPDERTALPATRFIDLRHGEFFSLVIGGHLSLQPNTPNTDLTRVKFDGSNFTGSAIFNQWLDGSSFRKCKFDSAIISSPSARQVDFSDISARGALFSWDAKTAEPFHIEHSSFDNSNLAGVSFDQVMFIHCSFIGTNLAEASYKMANFSQCDLSKATLGKADFSKSLNALSQCQVTRQQSTEITLPAYCHYEDTADPDVKMIQMDWEKYHSAFTNRSTR